MRSGTARILRATRPLHMRSGAATSSRFRAYRPKAGDVVIDALFGAGLSRAVPGDVALVMQAVTQALLPVIAVDLPSGLDGRTGQVLGESFRASHTVTFMARKPGHLLMPGRSLCGRMEVCDIGIPQRILLSHASGLCENGPASFGRE